MRWSKKARQQMSGWDISFLEMLDSPRCVLCTGLERADKTYLTMLFDENINEIGVRDAIRKAGGFCSRHTAALKLCADVRGATILYADILDYMLVCGYPPRWALCPLCGIDHDVYDGYRYLIARFLREMPHLDVPLCWPHLKELTSDRAVASEIRRLLWRDNVTRLNPWDESLWQALDQRVEEGSVWQAVADYFSGQDPQRNADQSQAAGEEEAPE